MSFKFGPKLKVALTIHKKSFNEVFWMTLASITPVILTWLFLTLNENEITFNQVVLDIFLDGPIFAYVAALLAPFLFLLTKYFSGANKNKLSFGGFSLFVAIVLTILSVFLFYDKQVKLIEEDKAAAMNAFLVSQVPRKEIERAKGLIKGEQHSPVITKDYSLRDGLALFCYGFALLLFYYSVYIKNKEEPDLDQDARDRNKALQETIDYEFGDE
jgi:hypothetical protein